MIISLKQYNVADLKSMYKTNCGTRENQSVKDSELIPPHVISRSIQQLEDGLSSIWVAPFQIVDSESTELVGSCGFKNAPENQVVEIGYNIGPSYRNRGAASQAIALLIEYAFSILPTIKVIARISHENIASLRVIEKCGFYYESVITDESCEVLQQWAKVIDQA